jgi:hypothetical protein
MLMRKPDVQKPHCTAWCTLQRVQFAAVREPLDGLDHGPAGRRGQHQARAHRRAVDDDRAGAAHALLAAQVGAGQPEFVAQEVREAGARLGHTAAVLAVHREVHHMGGAPR